MTADLQKSIDDLSAAIDRKNELVDELVAACEAAIGSFERILSLTKGYFDQGKQWSRIDANPVIAEMYAATHPITQIRNVVKKAKGEHERQPTQLA